MQGSRTLAWIAPSLLTLSTLLTPLTVQAAAPPTDYATNDDPTLAALIAEALLRNPHIRAASADHAAALELVVQVTALPDPTLAVTGFAQSPQTRVGPQISGIAVSQKIPWYGKRTDRGEAADKQAAIRREFLNARRADVVRDVKIAYYDLAYLDRAIRIATQEEELLQHYESLARAQYSQGVGLQQAVVKLQAEITRVLSRRHDFLRQRVSAEAALNSLRDRPVHLGLAPVEIGMNPNASIDSNALYALARRTAPEVRAALEQVEHAEVGIRIARRRYWPDVVVGAGWGAIAHRRDESGRANPPPGDGKDTLSLTFGVNIPLYRARIDAGVRAATARVSAAKEAYKGTLNGVDRAVRSISFRLTTITEQIALFENALMPQAEQALRSTEEAYSTGITGVLDLLDSEEVLLDVRLGLARLQTDYMKALAEMERAIGTAFPARRES